MTAQPIKTLFAKDIDRGIEEVIKVDQTDDKILREEIDEYVVTNAIRSHYTAIFEAYRETPNKPRDGIGVWVSGFFGSGKSSFAKMLGLSVEGRQIAGEPAGERLAGRANDTRFTVLLKTINEQIPTHAVIFDVSSDRGIRSGNQSLTEIMYGLFLQSLGYAKDLDLSELEITLEEKGRLEGFEEEYRRLFNKEWTTEKGKVAFALSEASRVLQSLDPATWPMADSWVRAVKNKADVTPAKLAERAGELMKRRRPGRSLLLVVDEVGQFVARDVQKMLDLQAIVQNLGFRGRGKFWLVVTSQEKLDELVSGLDDKRIEIARLMERFPQEQQVHLESSDISEVTSRRVLAKNGKAEETLGRLYDEHRARLIDATRLTADVRLPEISRDGFVDLYPLLPYQIDLVIQIVSGLRTQGGLSRHVGGANRTIIKLAQQLLINPAVNLANAPLGTLARLDHIYDLVENNIGSEIRAKITGIAKEIDHPLAQPVAKAICLLQYVRSVHRTPDNIAAALHPAVAAASGLSEVREALRVLEAAHKVRRGEDGYRIPTPAEDDWERLRNGISPRPGDAHRLFAETLLSLWQPPPSHVLADVKTFKAGLWIHGREVVDGDLMFHFHLAEDGAEFQSLAAELRARSQQERKSVFWAVALNEAIDRETVQLFRSKEMLARKEREAKTETSLIGEEKLRLRGHQDELRRLLRTACLAGSVYFRGNDRSPSGGATDVGKSAAEILGVALPQVFERFNEAGARPVDVKRGLDALFTAENLRGLPSVFSSLGLLRDEGGRTVFRTEGGPLVEILKRIEERSNYGDTASGRYLADEFVKEPFGWDFDVVRLLVLSLLRAGRIEATSKSQTIDSATSIEARDLYSNNNVFRQASFRPKKGIEFEELVRASEAFRDTFGAEVRELNAGIIVAELRRELQRQEDGVASPLADLTKSRLPGDGILETALGQIKAILRGSEDTAIGTFNASFRSIKDAIKRAAELRQALTEPRLRDLERAQQALTTAWPFLEAEPVISEELRTSVAALRDLIGRETFYRELPAIDEHAGKIITEYEGRYADAIAERVKAYSKALNQLGQTSGWENLDEEQQQRIAAPLRRGASPNADRVTIPQLRSERDACDARLRAAIAEVHRIIDGERLVTVALGSYFDGGVETEEQLDSALAGIREECARLIGAGKKVLVQ
jgi:hypothetical protein